MINWRREIENLPGWSFGDSPDMADDLARATAEGKNLANCFLWSNDAQIPKVGDRSYVKNFKGNPVCVIEVTNVQKKRFCEVDEAFAKAEGYNSLEEWRSIHCDFFRRRIANFDDQSVVICQLFKLLHVF